MCYAGSVEDSSNNSEYETDSDFLTSAYTPIEEMEENPKNSMISRKKNTTNHQTYWALQNG